MCAACIKKDKYKTQLTAICQLCSIQLQKEVKFNIKQPSCKSNIVGFCMHILLRTSYDLSKLRSFYQFEKAVEIFENLVVFLGIFFKNVL